MGKNLTILLLFLTGCAGRHPHPDLKIGDRVCASPCPKTCDLIVKEFAQCLNDYQHPEKGTHLCIWTEPACMGPVGLYGPKDLKRAN